MKPKKCATGTSNYSRVIHTNIQDVYVFQEREHKQLRLFLRRNANELIGHNITDQPTINQTNSNVVDGINLDEIKDFAKAFKLRRLSLGLTQTQVGQALSVTEGPAYSQSAICRYNQTVKTLQGGATYSEELSTCQKA